MKNRIIKFHLLVIAMFLFQNCNDEFLERYPLDTISNETFWNTESDLRTYNNNLYFLTANDDEVPIMWGASMYYEDYMSDNFSVLSGYAGYNQYYDTRFSRHQIPVNASNQAGGYRGWSFIRAVNIGLANYSKANVSEAVINRYAGEARLFRGWFYADKVSKFGDVAWVDNELNVDSPELYAPRTPRDEVMEKVLEDLNFAVAHLPSNWGDGNAPGRLNRWAALLVKSRVCLFEGTWRKYHGGSNANFWLEQSAAAASELIGNSPYQLYNIGDPSRNYTFHRMDDYSGVKEIISWRKYAPGIVAQQTQSLHQRTHGGATKNMVEDYLCSDGLPISISPLYAGDETLEDIFINRDPRLRQTVLHPEDAMSIQLQLDPNFHFPRLVGQNAEHATITNSGYYVIKNWNRVQKDLMSGGYMPNIILRLGEAMLNYAEAKAELGTLTQADLDMSINKLRDRVGMPHFDIGNIPDDPRYTGEGLSPLIVEIRRERRVELFGEGFRYNDLRRWKQGKKLEGPVMGIHWDDAAMARFPGANVVSSIDPVSGKSYIDVFKGTQYDNAVFDENKHYLWPIPLNIITENPNITQNPNW